MKVITDNNYEEQKEHYLKAMATVDKTGETKLILIIVANTLDSKIGKGCVLDIENVQSTIRRISKYIDFKLVELVIEGKNYNDANVLSALNALNPDADDIVIFYYTGHGFRFENEGKIEYPQIDLRKMPAEFDIAEVNKTTKNLNDIYDIIKTKGARLNLVIGDCCNDEINFVRSFGKRNKKTRKRRESKSEVNKEVCKALFCTSKSSILIASAKKGQLSIVDDGVGSIFTLKFIETLNKFIHAPLTVENEFPWEKVLEKTKVNTFRLSKTFDIGNGKPGNQQAFFEIHSEEFTY